jgi:hypothetical protein
MEELARIEEEILQNGKTNLNAESPVRMDLSPIETLGPFRNEQHTNYTNPYQCFSKALSPPEQAAILPT